MQVPLPEPQELALSTVLKAVLVLLGDELEGVDAETDIRPESLTVMADPVLLDQVLINLVRNAAQAMVNTPDRKIVIRAQLDYGRVLIQVIDNGPGIPDNLQDQIFIPFFTTKRDGSGIGLSLSRQIMTAHGGELAASSNEEGTVMSLLF